MLEKERFLAIKKLANDIRNDNDKIFDSFAKLSYDKAINAKEKFINSVITNMNIDFSDGEQGREEKQIFRANLLIPDDQEFFDSYSNDKNIRSLMNKYVVNIEDVMSKITELNVYSKYIEEAKKESKNPSFVDEMVKISPKEAESLLDEIDSLSSVMDDLEIPKEENEASSEPETAMVNEEEFNDSFDDITSAVSDFVASYDDMQEEIKGKDEKINSLKAQLEDLKSINRNLESVNKDIETLKKENEALAATNKKLEIKLAKSAEILNKIYKSISKK
ncbi:MAG: hypothetical protein PUA73_03530 [Bacilli bacterium]|nr:hypothetical protein [Bacilli bacterium]